LRESDDPLEIEGMRRTRRHLEQADVLVQVVDAAVVTGEPTPGEREVLVLNKIDLCPEQAVRPGAVAMCCLDGRGLEDLVDAIMARTDLASLGRFEETVAVNARHQQCLRTAADYLAEARRSLERGDAPELTALELRAALAAIGEITGAIDTEEVLGRIFSTFCIGK
jgi:tRNA modification GTPase